MLAALRDGMMRETGDSAVGGIPETLRIDHGLEFCADAVRTAAAALDIDFSLATTYAPEEKGKIERLHRTCVQTFLSGLPLYTGVRADRILDEYDDVPIRSHILTLANRRTRECLRHDTCDVLEHTSA